MLSRPGSPRPRPDRPRPRPRPERPRPRPAGSRPRPQKSGLDRSGDQDQVSRPTSLIVNLLFNIVVGMCARTMLAALDNNNNVGRQQATVKSGQRKGEARYNAVFRKDRKSWIARPVYQPKSYEYIDRLMENVKQLCINSTGDVDYLPKRHLPRNIAAEDKPEKKLLIQEHQSRFDAQ